MWTRQRRNTKRSRLILPALTAACLAYFGFHALHGSFGLYSSEQLEVRKIDLAARLQTLTREHETLNRQVALLQDDKLERDMLDEQARLSLNYSQKRDLTILKSDFMENALN
ncbi:MAG: septum formation initiator family protein [Rhizobiaceae bacterium]